MRLSGPSSTPPIICLRSAILQSAAASIVEGILFVTVSTAERMATLPIGLGSQGAITLDPVEMDAMLKDGVRWAITRGGVEA
jgi:hypothetical protein